MNENSNYLLRIDKKILDAIRQSAKENGRSVNKEIEFILKTHARQNGYLEE